MNNNEDIKRAIAKEDKSNLKGFLVLLVLSFIGGGLFGMLLVGADKTNIMDTIATAIANALEWSSLYVGVILFLVTLPIVVVLYKQAKKGVAAWDGEDEDQYKIFDGKLTKCLFVTTILQILIMIFLPIGFVKLPDLKGDKVLFVTSFLIFILGFIVVMAFVTIVQQKVVNLAKELNPEKKGSVYDMKFSEKWINSCDEAEQKNIHEAAFAAYNAVGIVIMILWFACIAGMLVFDWGLVPVVMLGIVWLVQTIAYFVKGIKLDSK